MRIVAYGKPITQGSKNRGRFSTYDSNAKTLKPWRQLVHHAALEALGGKPRIEIAVAVEITFYFDRPKGHYRTGRNAHLLRESAPALPDNKGAGDIDKLQRSCFDALTTAGVWRDDAQICDVIARKRYCDEAGLYVKPCVVIDVSDVNTLAGVA